MATRVDRLIAITRAVGATLPACQLTFRKREPIDVALAAEQHAAYCDALRQTGIAVEVLPANDRLPDAVFVEDTAVVLDEVAVIARPGTPKRRKEVASVAAALQRYRTTARIEAPATLEGGDVLRIGRQLFVGLTSRTNQAGFDQLSAIGERHGYRTVPVRVEGCLHLKSAVTALDDDTLLMNPDWLDAGALAGFRHVAVPAGEPFAANALAVQGVVHLTQRCPRTRELLQRQGFATRTLDVSEFEKAEAALTCLSVILASPAATSPAVAPRSAARARPGAAGSTPASPRRPSGERR